MMGKNEPEEVQEGAAWMATYSDMVTLLFAFFVLLFAISNVDKMKWDLVSAALSGKGLEAEEFLAIQEKYGMDGDSVFDLEDPYFPGPEQGSPTPGPGEAGNESLNELHTEMTDYIQYNDLADSISLVHNGDHLLMTLASDIWFASGSAEVTPGMRESAVVLGTMLNEIQTEQDPFEVVVVGHTDDRPINTSEFPNNWFLSMDRAGNFLGVLLEDSGLDPNYFSARGCGEYYPIAENDTDEGRQQNRRVEVMISQSSTNPMR